MTDRGPVVGYLLGGALVVFGVIILLMRHRIASSIHEPMQGLRPKTPNGLNTGRGRQLLLVCSLLILGGTALMLGAAIA